MPAPKRPASVLLTGKPCNTVERSIADVLEHQKPSQGGDMFAPMEEQAGGGWVSGAGL